MVSTTARSARDSAAADRRRHLHRRDRHRVAHRARHRGRWVDLAAGSRRGSRCVLVFATLSYRWPPRAYQHTSYRVDDQGIEIRRGVYWRVVINVPRSRVQHIDVSQGPIERRYGLGTLVIYTAGTDHAKVELEGLEHGRALRIREHLLPSESGDAV